MARFIVDCVPAVCENGFVSLRYFIGGDDKAMPGRTVEARTTAEAMAALETYKAEAKATGLALGCTIWLAKGERAPAGFRKVDTSRFSHLVNV